MASEKYCLMFHFVLFMSLVILALPAELQDMSIEEYIDYINPPALHKYKNEYGDTILCINYLDQISLRPDNKQWHTKKDVVIANNSMKACPESTIPVMEITYEQVKRAGSVAAFVNGKPLNSSKAVGVERNEHAIVSFTAERIYKAQAFFNIWSPYVDNSDGGIFSMCHIWVINGESARENIEAGLVVYPEKYNNDQTPRLFTQYWRDGERISCFNLDCDGFVVEGNIYLGQPVAPSDISHVDQSQREIAITIKRETRGGSGGNAVWALYWGPNLVGHWPSTLFKYMPFSANRVDFGGQVRYRKTTGLSHTKTDMGSGHLPPGGFKKSAFIRDMKLFNRLGDVISNRKRRIGVTNAACYDAKYYLAAGNKYWPNYMYYGGPGGDLESCQI